MTRKGVWNLQQVRDKELQSLWAQTYQLWVGGRDSYGGLGQNAAGVSAERSSPVQVPGTNWNALAVGQNYNMAATKTDGTLWAWGNGNNGSLGVNQPSDTDYSSPIQIGTDATWGSSIVGPGNFFLATKTDGTLWGWGNGSNGRLGLNNTTKYSSPVQVGSATKWGSGSGKLASGEGRAFGINTDGELFVWGNNPYGVLGLNNLTQYSSPTQIPGTWSTTTVGGGDFGGAVNTDGELFMWGSNQSGGLGQNQGGTLRISSPVQIPGTTWKQLACMESASMATKTDGTLWAWGSNDEGYLGINSLVSYSSPVQVPGTTWDKVNGGGDCFMAVKTDGTLWTWGINDYGQLVLGDRGPGASTARSSPTQVPGAWTLDKIDGGRNHDVFGAIKKGLTPSQL